MVKILKRTVLIIAGLILLSACSGMPSSQSVIEIKDTGHLNSQISSCSRLAVFFYFPSCPGCRAVNPHFNDLADKYKDSMAFFRVNIRENRALAQKYNVRAVPRFMFFENGENVSGLIGIRDTDELPDLIKKYAIQDHS